MFWEIIFWVSVAGLAHSYMIYPAFVLLAGRSGKPNSNIYTEREELPEVSVLLAAYNEEAVIANKIESTFETGYPPEKIEFLIGSDASSDQTDSIIKGYQKQYPGMKLYRFAGRTGKAGIINELAEKASHSILVLTDANVIFSRNTIYHMVKHFKNPDIGVVGGRIVNRELKKDGISYQEKTYLDLENQIKYYEGILWGAMAGAFGGCYAIRKDLYAPVPPNFFMDDFYITMHVLEGKKKAINETKAVCYEDVSNRVSEEFRRKVRISVGNFQNLMRYRKLLFPWRNAGLAFSFFSHKVLRWFGPFFLLLALIANALLFPANLFYQWTFAIQIAAIAIPFLDQLMKLAGVHNRLLRFVSHFYLMNLALLTGFFRFLKGVDSNVWKPTQRYQ